MVVNGWPESRLMKRLDPLVRLGNRLRYLNSRLAGEEPARQKSVDNPATREATPAKGTFINRHGVAWLKDEVGGLMPVEILVWRSVSVRFMRSLIHTWLGGRYWLRLLYRLEERYPHWFGENGQYPLIVIRKDVMMEWNDKNVLVTGGTGSFGKKFIEVMLHEFHPAKLIVFSRDELKQHEMRVERVRPSRPCATSSATCATTTACDAPCTVWISSSTPRR